MGSSQLSRIGSSLRGGPAGLVTLFARAEIVRREVAAPDPGVIIAGEKIQLSALGMPAQESAIGVFNDPDCVSAVTVTAADCPAGMVSVVGAAPSATVGGMMFELHDGV